MANNIKRIAKRLGAKVIASVPETGGGAFGAARLGLIVQALQARLRAETENQPDATGRSDT